MRWLRRLAADRRCAAAVEFAIIAPVMVVMFLGTIELVNAYRVQSKLNFAAGQYAQLVAGQSAVTEGPAGRGPGGSLGDMCTAAADDMVPYNPANLSGWIESETAIPGFFGSGVTTDWANDEACPSATNLIGSFFETITMTAIAENPYSMFTRDGAPRPGSPAVPGYSAIIVKLTYTYTNVLPFILGPTLTFTGTGVARPRSNAPIPCTYGTNPVQSCQSVY